LALRLPRFASDLSFPEPAVADGVTFVAIGGKY